MINKDFEDIWIEYIMPLKGKIILTATGKKNTIISVSSDSLLRLSSNNRTSKIDKQIFKDVFNLLKEKGSITRVEINKAFPKRCSSIVTAILGTIPYISIIEKPRITLIFNSSNRQ